MIARIVRITGQVLLSVTAVVGVCCLLMTIAGALFGVRPLIFRSGSMSPTITTGSLAIARPVDADRLKIGDIVSVPVGNTRVAHRITKITRSSGAATLQLKGDANPVPDARSYQVARADKIVISVPELGRAIAWLSRAPGIFVLAGYAALMFALVLRGRPSSGSGDHDQQRRPRPRRRARRVARVRPKLLRPRTVAGTTLLGVLPILQAAPSWAAWSDTAQVSGSSLSTATLAKPTLGCSVLGVTNVNLSWNAVGSATSYDVYTGTTLQTNTTSTTYALPASLISLGGSAHVVAKIGSGSTAWHSPDSNTVGYSSVLVTLCS